MTELTPKEIVAELDKHIIGQADAKRAVSVALRNRWRRQQLPDDLRDEVLPKNILIIGPTGVGKTEIARRLAKLADAPFIKVEATKYTEVGYVGRDVEQIIRDLMESAVANSKVKSRKDVKAKAEKLAEERLITALVGESASAETKQKFRAMLKNGELEERDVEIEVNDDSPLSMPTVDVPGMPGAQMGMLNLGDMFGKQFGGGRTKTKRMHVKDARETLIQEEADKLLDQDKMVASAVEAVEQRGIVFIDEIDKIAARSEFRGGGDVSREGVQRDLLPLIEGTTVSTKYGQVKTDHVLFICSGAFHIAKPSDLLPELQGRLPIRVELSALTQNDLRQILTDTQANLVRQYKALMETEGLTLTITADAVDALAKLAAEINATVENIGARRLHTVLERLLEDISFDASERKGETVTIDAKTVQEKVGTLAKNADLSKFIL